MWSWLQNPFLSDFRWFYDWEVQDLLAKKEALSKVQENYFLLESARSPRDVPGRGTGRRVKGTNQPLFYLFSVHHFKNCIYLSGHNSDFLSLRAKKGLCHHPSWLVCCPRKNVRLPLESWTHGKTSGNPCKSMTELFLCCCHECFACWVSTSSSFLNCSLITPSILPEQSTVLTCSPCLFWKYPWAYLNEIPNFLRFPTYQ